jgi:hypothetical protein
MAAKSAAQSLCPNLRSGERPPVQQQARSLADAIYRPQTKPQMKPPTVWHEWRDRMLEKGPLRRKR